jgi:hypothetical protein
MSIYACLLHVYMHMHIYECVHGICVHTCAYMCMHVCILQVCVPMCMYMHISIRVYMCMCVHAFVCICVCLYVYMHVYACVYICVCVHVSKHIQHDPRGKAREAPQPQSSGSMCNLGPFLPWGMGDLTPPPKSPMGDRDVSGFLSRS